MSPGGGPKGPVAAVGRRRLATALAACLLAAGCGEELTTEYGRRGGAEGGDSVNGTAVLARMFEAAGHQVSGTSWLAPRTRKADIIVWAPDDFKPPSREVRDWFEDWLDDPQHPGRTLIFIGRDYDAATAYWRTVEPGAPQEQQAEIKRRLARDTTEFLTQRQRQLTGDETNDWFTVSSRRRFRQVRSLSGQPEWTAGIDPKKLEIELNGRLQPPGTAEIWLASEGDALISAERIGAGRLIVVVNGSLLLNLPLVNHEHRKLAARLIDEAGPGRVVFVESDESGPHISDQDPRPPIRNGMEVFGVRPFNWIFVQLGLLGLLFCACRFPVFGRARPLEMPPQSDFGRHVEALGTLLAKTRDRTYAVTRVVNYQQNIRREAGRFRRAAASAGSSPFAAAGPHPPKPTP